MALTDGALVAGRYQVERRLGGGNFGDVYRVREMQNGVPLRTLALKVMKNQDEAVFGSARGNDVAAEYASMVAATEAAPPELRRHFIQVYAMGDDPDAGRYMAMEYLSGADTLEKVIKRNAAAGYHPPASLVLRYGRQLLAALSVLHGANLVHCDIKPDNLYVQGETLRVGDFGLTARTSGFLTDSQGAGQIYYMAPEVFSRQLSAASDVYSAGLTLYELWTNTHPFTGEEDGPNPSARQMQLRDNWAYVPGQSVHPMVDASPLLDEVIATCLQRSLHRRYRDAAAALQALDAPPAVPAKASPDRARLDALVRAGDDACAAGDPAKAVDHFAAALQLDAQKAVLMHSRDARVEIYKKIISACRAAGKPSYAALYERKLKALP